jgi:hypothetical protein
MGRRAAPFLDGDYTIAEVKKCAELNLHFAMHSYGVALH